MTCFLRLNLVAVTKQFEREVLILNACTFEGRKVIDFASAQVSILKTKYSSQPIKKDILYIVSQSKLEVISCS